MLVCGVYKSLCVVSWMNGITSGTQLINSRRVSRHYRELSTTIFKGGWRELELCEFMMEITLFHILPSELDIIQETFE